jgi:hypothetical protein
VPTTTNAPARLGLAAALVALAACAGCGSANQRPVFPVSGKLTYKGEPMAGAWITFHPLDNTGPTAVRAFTKADKNGHYKLTTRDTDDGAPAGEYAVTIFWPEAHKGASGAEEASNTAPDRLKGAHAVASTTKLRATVREGPNTVDFTLP